MSDSNTNDTANTYTGHSVVVLSLSITSFLFYCLLLAAAVYMGYKHLYKGGRWRIMYLSSFYVLTIFLSISQMVSYGATSYEKAMIIGKDEDSERSTTVEVISSALAFCARVYLEMFQVAQMAELNVHIKLSAFQMSK